MNSTTNCFGRRATANPEPLMSRTLDSQLSFADLELSRLGVHLDPVLQGIDTFLAQQSDLVEHVRVARVPRRQPPGDELSRLYDAGSGRMSPKEAQRLLDSQKNDELMLPVSRKEKASDQQRPIKDW